MNQRQTSDTDMPDAHEDTHGEKSDMDGVVAHPDEREDVPGTESGDTEAGDTAESEQEQTGEAGDAGEAEQEQTGEAGDAGEAEQEDASAEDGAEERRHVKRRRIPAFLSRIRLPKSRPARILVLFLVVLLAGAGAGGFAWWQATTLPDDAAFRVGDRTVTEDQLSDTVDTWRAMYGVEQPQQEGKLAEFRKDSAKAYAVSVILDREARERGIAVADKSAQDALSRMISQQLGEGPQAREKFVQALGNSGTSEKDVVGEIKKQMAMSQLFNNVTEDVDPVTGEEVRKAFGERKNQLGTPEKRKLANIVLRSKEDAEQVLSDLRSGKSFRELAKQRSIDGATRSEGGDLGYVARNQLQDSYGKAAFSTEPGGTFGPVKNEFGWNVGKVLEVKAQVPAKYGQVKDTLKQQLNMERSLNEWRDWLAARIKDAEVEYADKYRPDKPDAAPQVQPGQVPVPGGSSGSGSSGGSGGSSGSRGSGASDGSGGPTK